MALPAPVLEAFSQVEQIAEEKDLQAPIDVLIERTRRIEGILKNIKLAEFLGRVEETSRAVGAKGADELEGLIESLRKQEVELAAKFKPMIQASRSLRDRSFRASHLKTAERAKHVNALDRHANALISVLKLLRDQRERMIILRAEIESPGDAPVFDNPEDLEQYLRDSIK